MTSLIEHAADVPLAPLFATAGLAAQLVWPLFRKRETMLSVQLGASCCYAATYALLAQQTATAICLTGAIQTSVALLAGDRRWLRKLGYVFLPAVLAIGALTYAGLPTILAVTACCLTMIGRLQSETLAMRRVQISATPFNATHDILIGAWPCVAGALVTFCIAFSALHREQREIRADAIAP